VFIRALKFSIHESSVFKTFQVLDYEIFVLSFFGGRFPVELVDLKSFQYELPYKRLGGFKVQFLI
jgi:hypothetical protein